MTGGLSDSMSVIYQARKPLILASASPRRQEYFQALGLDYQTRAADIDETPGPDEQPRAFVRRMALEKARAVMALCPDSWVVAADTVIDFAGSVLGKPRDAADAVAMLMRLSGKEHQVLTGICLGCGHEKVVVVRSVATRVLFAPFSELVARAYVVTGEPLDKAGAYGIQGKGAFLVKEVRGSYSNVVGLPLCELLSILEEHGVVEVAGASSGGRGDGEAHP